MAADRPHLAGGRVGEARAALARLSASIVGRFEAAGASRVDPAALHPAEALLEVYGEDLRARAFVTTGADGSELCLRPDFTVPVLQLHLQAESRPARYCYLGPVWRRQPPGSARPREYLQAGLEIFGEDPAEADAELFALVLGTLREAGVAAPRVVTGDLGVLLAIVDATPTTPRRRAALKRHFCRPARFQSLLRRYASAPQDPSPARRALLDAAGAADPAAAVERLGSEAGEWLGARSAEDVAARGAALAKEAAAAPIPAESAKLLDAALAVEGPSDTALDRLRALAGEAGVELSGALDRLERRLAALDRLGLDPGRLPFRAAAFRTLEYYDGFVFELSAPDRPDLPPLAGGGRYDGIAEALGAARPAPAVGAMIRPEALLAAAQGEAP